MNGKAHIDINGLWNRLDVLTAREMLRNHLKINAKSDRPLWQRDTIASFSAMSGNYLGAVRVGFSF